MWVRLHKDSQVGSSVGRGFGWHLWHQRMANFPRDEMPMRGFAYLICDQPGANASTRVTATRATVRKFMDFRPATSLTDAFHIAKREFSADFTMSLPEWLADPYNAPIDPKWSGIFGMWSIDAVPVAPVHADWTFANCFCGWKQIDDALAAAQLSGGAPRRAAGPDSRDADRPGPEVEGWLAGRRGRPAPPEPAP